MVETKLDVQFNHVMLNKYNIEDIYIGLHEDNLENRVNAMISFSAEKIFIIRHRIIQGGNGVKR